MKELINIAINCYFALSLFRAGYIYKEYVENPKKFVKAKLFNFERNEEYSRTLKDIKERYGKK